MVCGSSSAYSRGVCHSQQVTVCSKMRRTVLHLLQLWGIQSSPWPHDRLPWIGEDCYGWDGLRATSGFYSRRRVLWLADSQITPPSGKAISTWDPAPIWKKRLARRDPGINRLDRIAKAHDIEYDKAKTLKDKWVADRKMIAKIDQLPGRKTLTERIVRRIMKTKLRLGMWTKKAFLLTQS